MKYLAYLLLLIIVSCNSQQQNIQENNTLAKTVPFTLNDDKTQINKEICWTGMLNGKVPVFLHYKIDSNLIIGKITYLNTKDKLPITIIGTIEDDRSYRLLEFEVSGNITGIITGVPTDNIFKGSWISPKTQKELTISLIKKDTIISSEGTDTKLQNIFGHYHYQYSEAGYQGDLEITKLPDSKAIFGITSVTSDPARNVAQIDDDTININTTRFIYKMPEADNCEFEVRFYNGFAYIKYTNGFCDGQFGMNATIDGIFLKTE